MESNANFSSPMPVIGLYMAGATLVCLLLMLCDIFNAIRRRKPWIPCRFFVFNSFTLTLLSVATKLPTDLTTSMPSAYDQLSKLCGTSFMCISIGFFRPSIAEMDESEVSANLASLTVMVITIVVNISLQISTGAIFLFRVEHIINCVLMLLLLVVTVCLKSTFLDYFSEPYRKSIKYKPRMVDTLKKCYIYSYITSPQLMFCRFSHNAAAGMLCTMSFVVLSEAAFRAYNIDDSGLEGASDYKWSIWAVVGSQMLSIVVGAFAIVFRCLALANQMQPILSFTLEGYDILDFYKMFLLVRRNLNLYSRALNSSRVVFQIVRVSQYVLDILLFLLGTLAGCLDKLILNMMWMLRGCFVRVTRKSIVLEEGDDETIITLRKEFETKSTVNFLSDRLLRKGNRDMELCIKKHSVDPTHPLLKFLGRSSVHRFGSVALLEQISSSSDQLLLLVCLVRMADSLVPSICHSSLVAALDQAFEIIVFIHEKTKTKSAINTLKINIAKDIWMNRCAENHWFQNDFVKQLKAQRSNDQYISRALRIADKHLLVNLVYQEVSDCINIIGDPSFDAISNEQMEEPHVRAEQLFTGLLHKFIDQLPDVIFNSMDESLPAVEFEKNAKISMKLAAKLNLLAAEPFCFASSKISSFRNADTVEENRSVCIL